MDNEYSNWNELPDDRKMPKKPESPFVNAPYEMYHQCDNFIEPQKHKRTKKHGKWILVPLIIALVALTCGITAVGVSAYWNQKMQVFSDVVDNRLAVLKQQMDALQGGSDITDSDKPQTDALTPGQVYAKNLKAVVAISNQSLTTNIYGQISQTASSGSGFIISADGYIVSNYHVVKGASKLKVITSDSKEYDAKLIGYDATNDVAVLKINGDSFPYVKLGSSDALAVGDKVMAIGNPLGELTSTLTVGYISAKDRAINTDGTYMNMLQTDAAINSGNSGGPLFNQSGEVIGITTAKYSGTSSSGATIEGIGFAIPIDDVVDLINDLVEYGFVKSAYLGIMVRDMDASVSELYGIPLGVYVDEVTPGSSAEAAGIKAKDIIINLGGHDVTSMSELTRTLRKLKAGEQTTVTVFRGGSQIHLNITPDEKPQETQTESVPSQQNPTLPGKGTIEDWFGSIFPDFGN